MAAKNISIIIWGYQKANLPKLRHEDLQLNSRNPNAGSTPLLARRNTESRDQAQSICALA